MAMKMPSRRMMFAMAAVYVPAFLVMFAPMILRIAPLSGWLSWRSPSRPVVSLPQPGPPAPYHLDIEYYRSCLEAAKDESERAAILEERWKDVVMALQHVESLRDVNFQCVDFILQDGRKYAFDLEKHVVGDLVEKGEFHSGTTFVEGGILADLKCLGGSCVIVWGDLGSTLTVDGISDVVVCGDILEGGSVVSDDMLQLFVGGDMRGAVDAAGSSDVWVHGTWTGKLAPGYPSTSVVVMRDFTGTVESGRQEYGFLNFYVHGFCPTRVLGETSELAGIDVSASIGQSDCERGIYPRVTEWGGWSDKWTVHSRRADK